MKFTTKEKKLLLHVSRESIEYFIDTKRYMPQVLVKVPDKVKQKLDQNLPVFILLKAKRNGNKYIRGEAGVFDPDISLLELVVQLSVHAAFYDPRTPRLKPFELNEIRISLLIPSDLKNINAESMYKKSSNIGFKADFRGRSTYLLPTMHEEFDTFDQLKNHMMLSLGAKMEYINEVEFSEFGLQEISE